MTGHTLGHCACGAIHWYAMAVNPTMNAAGLLWVTKRPGVQCEQKWIGKYFPSARACYQALEKLQAMLLKDCR